MSAHSKKTDSRKLLKKRSSRPRRSAKRGVDYGTLEERNLLTTIASFAAGTGVLSISLTAEGDTAIVGIADNNVTVNGNQVSTGFAANDVQAIQVNGLLATNNQSVAFNDNFAITGTQLSDIDIINVNQVSFNGAYDLSGDLNVTLNGSNGLLGDGAVDSSGRVRVAGQTTIVANDNEVRLDNATNNFNNVSVSTSGTNRSVFLSDINSINFNGVAVSGDLNVNVVGNVTDSPGTSMVVLRDANFSAGNVILGGEGDGEETRFFAASFDVSGLVDLQEDDNTLLRDVNANSLRLSSNGRIFDGKATTIEVAGLAELTGNAGIVLGENGIDTFNAGTLNFNSNGQVTIVEKSDIRIVGDNTARSTDLRTTDSITDANDATIAVQFQSGFAAGSVQLGDTETDSFNSSSVYFFVSGRFDLSEDSSTHVIEEKNAADTARIRSAGEITDESNTWITVANLLELDAASVDLGDTSDDQFNAGSIQFNTTGQFRVTENSDTVISGTNTAGNSILNSVGDLTNAVGADINVSGTAAFFGDSVTLGNQTGDNVQLGNLTFNTSTREAGTKIVNITEDDSTNFAGVSSANIAQIQSGGSITDGASTVNVAGNVSLTTQDNGFINIGNTVTLANGAVGNAVFNAGSVTFVTDGTGNVNIEEDSAISLAGTNRANSLTLNADDGQANIIDAGNASTTVQFNLNVTGNLINLGTGVDNNNISTDFLSFSTLTFNSAGNTNISADSDILLLGESNSDASLMLESTGSILDLPTARTMVQNTALFNAAMDVAIGELDDDCFDILSGTAATIFAPGLQIATLGCV